MNWRSKVSMASHCAVAPKMQRIGKIHTDFSAVERFRDPATRMWTGDAHDERSETDGVSCATLRSTHWRHPVYRSSCSKI